MLCGAINNKGLIQTMINVTKNMKDFIDACYEQNTLKELYDAMPADETDMANWNLTSVEWYYCISAAIGLKKEDL